MSRAIRESSSCAEGSYGGCAAEVDPAGAGADVVAEARRAGRAISSASGAGAHDGNQIAARRTAER